MDIGKRIHELRFHKGLTAQDLAERINVSQSYISLLENNKRRANVEVLAKIAGVFDMTLGQFFATDSQVDGAVNPAGPGDAGAAGDRGNRGGKLGIDLDALYRSGNLHALADGGGNVSPVKMRLIPVVSRVAAGDPAGYTDGEYPVGFAEEFVPAPADLDDAEAFALRIKGDSMSPRFRDGDIVICSPGRVPENGDTVVAKINSEETTCKVFNLDGTNVILSPANPAYPVQVYAMKEISWVYPVVISQHREKR